MSQSIEVIYGFEFVSKIVLQDEQKVRFPCPSTGHGRSRLTLRILQGPEPVYPTGRLLLSRHNYLECLFAGPDDHK